MQRLTIAVNDWLEKKGNLLPTQPDISLKHYAAAVGVPFETFRKYACSDVGKRRVLGAAAEEIFGAAAAEIFACILP